MFYFSDRFSKILIAILIFTSSSPVLPDYLRILLLILVSVALFNKNIFITKVEAFFVVMIVFVLVISLAQDIYSLRLYGLNSLSLIYIPFSFFIGFQLSKRFSFHYFMDCYEYCMKYLSIIALVIFIAVLVQPDFKKLFFSYTYYHTEHVSLFFYNAVSDIRNSGFSSEPGLYQYFISLALWWRLKKKSFGLITVLYIISLVSTFSSAAFLTLIFFVIIGSSKTQKMLFFSLILLFSNQIYDLYIFQKDFKFQGSAFEQRAAPLLNAISYVEENKAGVGSIKYTNDVDIYNIGGWDSFSQISLRYGLQGLIIILCLITLILFKFPMLFFIMIISFASQSIWFVPLVSCFYFYSLSYYRNV